MKNFYRLITTLIAGLLIAISIAPAYAADIEIPDVSRWTPHRDGIKYYKGVPSLSYPSFNNFYNQPDIPGAFANDERAFMAVRYCEGGDCDNGDKTYYNSLATLNEAKAGDKYRFVIYFHNNGADAYDGDGVNSPDAKNVRIGIDALNVDDGDYENLIRPRGFITADNNKYEGFSTRKATDDTQILIKDNLYLEPTNTVGLYIANAGFVGYITKRTPITFDTETGKQTIYASANTSGSNLWLEFDRMPGCTRYTGFAYFDVEVKERPEEEIKCKDIRVDHPATIYENTFSWFKAEAIDTDGKKFDSKIRYTVKKDSSGTPYGQLLSSKPSEIPENPSKIVKETSCSGTPKASESAAKSFSDVHENTVIESIGKKFNDLKLSSYTKSSSFSIGEGLIDNENSLKEFSIVNYLINFYGKETLTVDQCETVYFHAFSDSYPADAIEVETVDSSVSACREAYPSKPNKCELIEVTDKSGKTRLESIKLETGEIYDFKAQSEDELGNPISGDVVFESNAKNACIATSKASAQLHKTLYNLGTVKGETSYCKSKQNVEPGEVVWIHVYGKGDKTITVSQSGTSEKACSKSYDTFEEVVTKPVCKELNLEGPNSPVKISELPASYNLEAIDTDGNELAGGSDFIWNFISSGEISATYTQGGSEVTSLLPPEDTIKLRNHPVTFDNATAEGTLTVGISPDDPFYSPKCVAQIEIIRDEEKLVCRDLDTTVEEYFNPGISIAQLKPNTWYKVSTEVEYTPEDPDPSEVTYESNEAGVFIPRPVVPLLCNPNRIDSAEEALANPFCLAKEGPYTIEEGKTFYFLTYENISDNIFNALLSRATGRTEFACRERFPLKVEDVNPQPCRDIEVDFSPRPFDPTGETDIFLTGGNFGDFEGTFRFSAPSGRFYVPGREFFADNPKEFTIDQFTNGIRYDGGEAGDDIRITAIGENSGTNCNYVINSDIEEVRCIDLDILDPPSNWDIDDLDEVDDGEYEQRVRIDVTTEPAGYASNLRFKYEVDDDNIGDWSRGEITDSTINYLEEIDEDDLEDLDSITVTSLDENNREITACRDRVNFDYDDRPDDEPEIEKVVYDPDDDDIEDIINISNRIDNITYRIDFEPNDAKSAKIWDDALDNGVIESRGRLNGELVFTGMIIAVEGDAGEYIIYQSEDEDDFDVDRYGDEEVGDDQLSDYDDFGEDIDDYEDKYQCGNEKNDEVCLDHDFDDIEDIFKDGEKLKFDNTDKADVIHILYQVDNETIIDDAECKKLDATIDGCGERFDNEANFIGYVKPDFDDEEWDDSDGTRVIVICPYILTRDSGDTFFRDVFDTGSDVNACYEVTNVPIVIIERPVIERIIPRTGEGDDDDITFETPSHDVCKLSNTNSAGIPEYSDVFKNFSSSVCEFKAETANEWKETYINTAIETNITKLTRWGEFSGNRTIKSMSDVESKFDNLQSGVFVVDGDLTIDAGSGQFLINGTSKLPAAQTYIVKGGHNLIINSDVKYNDASSNVSYTRPSTLPVASFIVLDGDILISNEVERIDGILMAVDLDNSGDDGRIRSVQNTPEFDNTLTIRGSLIGDVYNIFLNRRAAGNPLRDEGSITIRYDERILLNTPPAISELIDISQLRTAN